ncbi:MAG: hypothetical protein EBZ62_03635 [Sphingobacteriia bacterium]|nr:hypothetical protein [Sphingobacteriia bacterium]
MLGLNKPLIESTPGPLNRRPLILEEEGKVSSKNGEAQTKTLDGKLGLKERTEPIDAVLTFELGINEKFPFLPSGFVTNNT